jgi:hypothetical protein
MAASASSPGKRRNRKLEVLGLDLSDYTNRDLSLVWKFRPPTLLREPDILGSD